MKSSIHKEFSAVLLEACSMRHEQSVLPFQFKRDISVGWPYYASAKYAFYFVRTFHQCKRNSNADFLAKFVNALAVKSNVC